MVQSGFAADTAAGLYTTKATGEQKYIVVFADFPDVKRQYPIKMMTDRIIGFVGPYFKAASNEKLNLKGDATKQYMLPNPVSYYKISPRNLEVDRSKVVSLVTDVVNAAEKDVDFSKYDYVLISLGASPLEYGMVGYCAVPGMLDFQNKTALTTKGGKKINNAAVFCEDAHMGTYIHDTLHMLGGYIGDQRMTPCLYDQDLQAKFTGGEEWSKIIVNVGFWDPLSSHFPYDKKLPPAGLTSWTKMRLSWIDPSKIVNVDAGQTSVIKLDPLSDPNANKTVIKIRLSDKTYILVENRQKIGSDANCPASGILIMYADDTVYECRNGKTPVKIIDANPIVPYLNDAVFDINKKDIYTDAKNNITVKLQKKEGLSYQVQIIPAEKAK